VGKYRLFLLTNTDAIHIRTRFEHKWQAFLSLGIFINVLKKYIIPLKWA
jgi:hypothetical protein